MSVLSAIFLHLSRSHGALRLGAQGMLTLVSLHSAEPQDERAPSAGAKSLAIPFDQTRWTLIDHGKTKCVGCGQDAKRWTMFGRSY